MKYLPACLFLLFAATATAADIWPQWRGPTRDCRIDGRTWPDNVTSNLKETFRVDLGDGYSGPIVSAKMVFVTETVGKDEIVRAIDRQSGSEIWQKKWKGSMKVPFFAAANGSWIRSTPALSENFLVVASMEDVLYCLNPDDGAELWKKDFREEFGTENQSFGFVCSPLIHDNHVYVQTSAGLLKIDCVTGTTVWRSLDDAGGMMGGAFSSPVIATLHDVEQLVVQTRSKLTGVSLDKGNVLWEIEVPAFRGMNILTPTIMGNKLFTSTYGGGSFLFEVTKSNADGGLSVAQLWKSKTEGYMSSPVTIGDNIYLHLRNQRFTCLDAKTGETRWTTKPFGKYWSMVVNGNRGLVLDERGDLILLDLNGEEFRQLDSDRISQTPAWAHLAVADTQVFVREQNALVCYEWAAEDSQK